MIIERGRPPSKWILRSVIGLVIVSQTAALLGDLALAGIVDRHPSLLIALNPRNRNLALATNQLNALAYYSIGFGRLVASDPLYYLLGYWFGERAIAWTERRSRTYGPFIRDGEQFFRRAAYPMIFVAPNSIICALAAATGVRLRAFILLNVGGTVVRLIVIRQLGEVFSSPIELILGFIAAYRVPLLILSAVGVAWTIFGEFRGDHSELNTLRHLEEEAEAETAAAESDHSPETNGDSPSPEADTSASAEPMGQDQTNGQTEPAGQDETTSQTKPVDRDQTNGQTEPAGQDEAVSQTEPAGHDDPAT